MAAVHCTLHRLHAQTVIKGVKEKKPCHRLVDCADKSHLA